MIALLLGLAQPAPPPAPPVLTVADAVKRIAAEPCVVCQFLGADDYPAEAIRNEEQGIVGIRMTINSSGRVSDCVVTRSSGSSSLDKATCSLLQKRVRLAPARDANGRAVAQVKDQRVRWVLPVTGPGDWVLRAIFAPDATGKIATCRVDRSTDAQKICAQLAPAAKAAAASLPPGSLAGREIVFETGRLAGADGGDALPVGKGAGETLLRRNVFVLSYAADRTLSCRAGAGDPMPPGEEAKACKQKIKEIEAYRFPRGSLPSGWVVYMAGYVRPATPAS